MARTGLPTPTRREYVPIGSSAPIRGADGWLRANLISLTKLSAAEGNSRFELFS